MEHANFTAVVLIIVLGALILSQILRARAGKELFIRRLAGVDAIEEAVGRATEMGRPILFSTGLGGLSIVTLQALAIASRVGRDAARYRTRMIVPAIDTVIYALAGQLLRESYAAEGAEDAFEPENIRFLSGSQFAFASGVVGLMNREQVAANFLFGDFAAESLILAETGHQLGAIQIAGTPSTLQIPFFICAADYTIIAEEYYATSAYMTREPTLLGSLVGQDYSKILLLALVLTGMALYTLNPALGAWFEALFR